MEGAERRAERLISRSPLSGAELGDAPIMGLEEVRGLVAATRAAQAEWAVQPVRRRTRSLQRLRRIMADRAAEIAGVIRSETGKATGEAMFEVTVACEHVKYIGETAPFALAGRRAGSGWMLARRARVAYEPYGVIGVIAPWNYPLAIGVSGVVSAIVAGNGVVLKPSEYAQMTGGLLAGLVAEATGLPDLVTVATGDGSTGAALIDAGVDKIAFTGSVATGKRVMAAAAKSLTPVVLELGGKDAMIVLEDADVERAARGAVWGAFYGSGQVCMSVERVYVVEAVYDEFVQAAVAEARRVRASDEPEATIGSMIAPFQVAKVERQLKDARSRGAKILLGGRPIDCPGHCFQPTVVVDVGHDMEIMRDETFGPVLPIMRVADEEEAIGLANDTDYGLDASVWTRSRARGRRVADRLDVGSVVINDHLINYTLADVPFGGTRHSGIGRIHGLEGLREFVRPKAVVEDRMTMRREPYWFDEGGSGEDTAFDLLTLRHGRGLLRRLGAGMRMMRSL